jgi:hypothetical protein
MFVKTIYKCLKRNKERNRKKKTEVGLHPEGPATNQPSNQLGQGFSVDFLGPRVNSELVTKFQAALLNL